MNGWHFTQGGYLYWVLEESLLSDLTLCPTRRFTKLTFSKALESINKMVRPKRSAVLISGRRKELFSGQWTTAPSPLPRLRRCRIKSVVSWFSVKTESLRYVGAVKSCSVDNGQLPQVLCQDWGIVESNPWLVDSPSRPSRWGSMFLVVRTGTINIGSTKKRWHRRRCLKIKFWWVFDENENEVEWTEVS